MEPKTKLSKLKSIEELSKESPNKRILEVLEEISLLLKDIFKDGGNENQSQKMTQKMNNIQARVSVLEQKKSERECKRVSEQSFLEFQLRDLTEKMNTIQARVYDLELGRSK